MSRETTPCTRAPTEYLLSTLFHGIVAHLAVGEADLAGVLVELLDADLHLLADLSTSPGMLHAVPAQLADVDQAVDAAQVDERAEVLQAADDAFADLARR